MAAFENLLPAITHKWAWHQKTGAPGGICDMALLHMWARERSDIANFAAVIGGAVFDININGAENLVKSTRKRLTWLDVPAHQIRALEKTREVEKNLHIHSPFDGIVVNIGAREGTYITPKTEIYMLASLSKGWVYVEVYE